MFVKDEGIIPLIPEGMHIPTQTEKQPLEIRHYGKVVITFYLYDDNGISFDYENGKYVWISLSATKQYKGRINWYR